MNILLSYATNSGSTYLVSSRIKKLLEDFSYTVVLKEIAETTEADIKNADICLWGSPSWDHEGKEGQPHLAFIQFFENNQDIDFHQKKCAVFGLGDRHYHYFCGAVGYLEQFILQHHGVLLTDSLKIDTFYCNEMSSCQMIDSWVDKIHTSFAET